MFEFKIDDPFSQQITNRLFQLRLVMAVTPPLQAFYCSQREAQAL